MSTLLRTDWRDAWRSLCATPLVTALAVLSLALGHWREHGALLDPEQPAPQEPARLTNRSAWSCSTETRGPIRSGKRSARTGRQIARRRVRVVGRAVRPVVERRVRTRSMAFTPAAGCSRSSVSRRCADACSRRQTMCGAAGARAASPSSVMDSGSGACRLHQTRSGAGSRSTACRSRSWASRRAGSLAPTWDARADIILPLGTEALDPRQRELARRPLELVAQHHAPAQTRADRSPRPPTSSGRCSRRSVGDDAAAIRTAEDQPNYLRDPFTLVPAASGRSTLRSRYRAPAHRHDGRRRPGAADRLRQHRQPADGPRDSTAARAERPPGARRVAAAARPPAARRKPDARPLRRRDRARLRAVGQPHARRAVDDARQLGLPQSHARLARAGLHGRRRDRDRDPVRRRPGTRGQSCDAERSVEGAGANGRAATAASASARRSSSCRSHSR